MSRKLIFVYNADSGLFNTVTDIAHKILSPGTYACNLCALTHGHFKVREEWVNFLETLDVDCEFLHRDEFLHRHPGINVQLPAIFLEANGQPVPYISSEELSGCHSLDELKSLVRRLPEDQQGNPRGNDLAQA